jgi:23S rRNA pseudoU1915 N3-methylase RlmH
MSTSTCAVCNMGLVSGDCVPYAIGGMRGRLCARCGESFAAMVTKWMPMQMEVVHQERERAIKDARAKQEKEAAEILAKEVAHSRLAALAAEGTPFATPKKRRAA